MSDESEVESIIAHALIMGNGCYDSPHEQAAGIIKRLTHEGFAILSQSLTAVRGQAMSSSTNIVPMQGNAGIQRAANVLVPTTMDQAMRLAEIMSKGSLTPEHLHGNVGDCFLIVEQSMRWQMSPFAVAQCSFVHKGKLGFEGKLIAAATECSGAIDGGFDYEFIGDAQKPDTRGVVVRAVRRGESKPREITIWWRDAHTTAKDGAVNASWKKQPDQMLVYHGVRVWARRWTPSVILGAYTREELSEGSYNDGPTIDAVAEDAADRGPEEEKPPPKPREYPMTTARWSKVFDNPVEWRDAWAKLIRNCVAADALDKLRSAVNMNEGAFASISEIDAETSNAIQKSIKDALAQSGGPTDPSLEDRVDSAIQVFASCMTHANRQKAEQETRDLLFELDQAQRDDLRNKLVDTMSFTMQRITKREGETLEAAVSAEVGK